MCEREKEGETDQHGAGKFCKFRMEELCTLLHVPEGFQSIKSGFFKGYYFFFFSFS